MCKQEIFHIDYPTGCMDINVASFFGKADKARVKKVLKLAKQNCSEAQRVALIGQLQSEAKKRVEVMESCAQLKQRRLELLDGILTPDDRVSVGEPMMGAEKYLAMQAYKMGAWVEFLENVRWLA